MDRKQNNIFQESPNFSLPFRQIAYKLVINCPQTLLLYYSSGLFNSRKAIAGAIIGLLLVFYNSKNLNCFGALSFLRLEEEYWRSLFYDSKRSIGEVLFTTRR